MLTRLLHACGLYLGPQEELMPAQTDNPDGFWEHLGFVALNDELLNALGGAWDLPPKREENFAHAGLDPLRMKARLLVEKFDSAGLWGWKDPRNSLTLPFWQKLLPGMKTLIVVRNPLEVAHSMKERNGTSYSFGLRLWEIYNRRVIEAASEQGRLVTHYDLFFDDAERELRRIADFIGIPDAAVENAATLVKKRRRHTHFTVDHLIDARVAPEVIDVYRALIAEASADTRMDRAHRQRTAIRSKPDQPDLLSGAVTRLNAFVPESIARLSISSKTCWLKRKIGTNTQIEELSEHLARQNASIAETNQLLREKSLRLAKSETREDEMRKRLRQQLKATEKLCRFWMRPLTHAATRLRSSARWQIANPIAALKAKLSSSQSQRAVRLWAFGKNHFRISRNGKLHHPEIATIDDQIQALISGTDFLSLSREWHARRTS